jgi:hypothetical protein
MWNNLPDNIMSALNGEVFRNRMAKNNLPGNIKSAPNGEVFRNRMANLYAKFSDIQ